MLWKQLCFFKILVYWGVTKTIKSKAKEKRGVFLGILLGTLATRLFRHMLAGKGFIQADDWTTSQKRQRTIRAGEDF